MALPTRQEAGTLLTPCGCVWTGGQCLYYSNLCLAGNKEYWTDKHSFPYLPSRVTRKWILTSGNTNNTMQWCDIKRSGGRKSNYLDTKLRKAYLASCHCKHRASLLSGHSSRDPDSHSWLYNMEYHRPLLSSTCHTHSTPGSVQTDWLCTCHVLSSY